MDEINKTKSDAMSPVQSFTTLPSSAAPSRVKNFQSSKKTSTKITLTWDVLENEKNLIEFFFLNVVAMPFNQKLLDQRNYCIFKMEPELSESDPVELIDYQLEEIQETEPELDCCDQCCKASEEVKKTREKYQNDFQASIKKFSENVRKSVKPLEIPESVQRFDNLFKTRRDLTIYGLDPFTTYYFYLQACSSRIKCGYSEFYSEMTLKSEDGNFDRVEILPTNYEFEMQSFFVYFEEPQKKNGLILNYKTEIWSIEGNLTVKIFTECITREQHERNGYK